MEQTEVSVAPVSHPSGAACPWCTRPLADPSAQRCPSCDAALQPADGVETVVPGLTELTADAVAARGRANGTAGAASSTAVPHPTPDAHAMAAFAARAQVPYAPPVAPEPVVIQQELFAPEPVVAPAPEPVVVFDPVVPATAAVPPARDLAQVDLTVDELSVEAVRSLAARETFEDVSDESFAPPSDAVQKVMRELKRAAAEAARHRFPTAPVASRGAAADGSGSDTTA
jgi:hypothetical protein